MIRRLPVPLLLTLLMPLAGCQVSASTTDIVGRDATLAPEASQTTAASAAEQTDTAAPAVRQDFVAWVADFRRQALTEGINAVTLAAAFDDVRYLPRVIELDRAQPEFTRQVWDYLDTAISPARIQQGRAQLAEYRAPIQAASRRYGVPAEILVAIWGIESNYGGNFGDFSTLEALATLAYDGRRRDFARDELLAAARAAMAGMEPVEVTWLTDVDAYYYERSGGGARLPALRAKFNDEDETWLYLDGQGFSRVLIDHRQHAQFLTASSAALHKVHGPHVVAILSAAHVASIGAVTLGFVGSW